VARRKPINPFYTLLLLAGCAFAVTACAFGVMTVGQLYRYREAISEMDRFTALVDQHGTSVMIVELVLLGVGTFGAIAYDQHLDKKASASRTTVASEQTEETS